MINVLGSDKKQCKLKIKLPRAKEMNGGDVWCAAVLRLPLTSTFPIDPVCSEDLKANSHIARIARNTPVLL